MTWTWGKLAPHFSCNCEKNLDDMRARWICPVHGERWGRPIDDPGFRADMIEYQRRDR